MFESVSLSLLDNTSAEVKTQIGKTNRISELKGKLCKKLGNKY
jgi:hypothetical protein